ncbi:MAG: hypothetical protein ABJX82_18595 [Paracoccaceae bacterium]
MSDVTATATTSVEVDLYVKQRGLTNVFKGGGLLTVKTDVGFSMSPPQLGEAEINPLFLGASLAPFNTASTATVLGRDPDMHRNVSTTPLPRSRKKEPSAAGEQRAKKTKSASYTHKYTLGGVSNFIRLPRSGVISPTYKLAVLGRNGKGLTNS